MISLLHLLHAIAAERGDGLHPKLRKQLSKTDANEIAEHAETVESAELPGDPTPIRVTTVS